MAPLLLQVPITITGGRPEIGKVAIVPETIGMAKNLAGQEISAAKSRLSILKGKLRSAVLAYKKSATPANYKMVESIKAEIRSLKELVKRGRAKLDDSYRRTIVMLRGKIRVMRTRVRTSTAGKKKVMIGRLNELLTKYYDLRINHLQGLIKRNRANAAAIRRHVARIKNTVMAIIAEEKRQTIPNPALTVRKVKERARLVKVRLDLKKANVRFAVLKKRLDRLRAAKNRFGAKKALAAAAAGVAGQVSGSIDKLRKTLHRHEMILRKLLGNRPRNTKCGNLGLARRRRDTQISRLRVLQKAYKLKPTSQLRVKIRRQKEVVARHRSIVHRIVKCKGLMFCGNLKRAHRNLARAKAKYAKVMEIAKSRPSDEDSQKARHLHANRIKRYRREISKIWTCICNRAQVKYHQHKRMYSRTKKPVHRERMLLHKRMLRRCNCRAANINFERARKTFIKFRNQFQANTMDQQSKEKMNFYHDKVMTHYNRLKMYKCKLPPLPRTLGKSGGVKVGRRRR